MSECRDRFLPHIPQSFASMVGAFLKRSQWLLLLLVITMLAGASSIATTVRRTPATMAIAARTPYPDMQIHWLPDGGEARCMDGSRYGFYFRAGSHPTRWVIEMQGGGWCYNEGDCYGRTLPSYARGVFGSSKNWSTTFLGWAIESPNVTLNPDFHSWNHVFMPYCSGASFTGYRADPWAAGGWPIPGHPGEVVPNGTMLYFRGAKNVEETVQELQRSMGMGVVDELIVTGASAGGLATILNVDRIAALTRARRSVGLPNAGFFKYEANHTIGRYAPSGNFSASMR